MKLETIQALLNSNMPKEKKEYHIKAYVNNWLTDTDIEEIIEAWEV